MIDAIRSTLTKNVHIETVLKLDNPALRAGGAGVNVQHRLLTSPRLRGEVDFERSEKSGEGASPSARTRGELET